MDEHELQRRIMGADGEIYLKRQMTDIETRTSTDRDPVTRVEPEIDLLEVLTYV